MDTVLIVYIKDSFYKFHRLWSEHTYELADNQQLTIYSISRISGEAKEKAIFRNWDYFIIEREEEWNVKNIAEGYTGVKWKV